MKQFIKHNENITDLEIMSYSFPRDSFANGLKNYSHLLDPVMFSNDSNLFYVNRSIQVLIEELIKS